MKNDPNNDENEINQICDQIINNIMPKLNNFQEIIFQNINKNFASFDQLLGMEINNYTNELKKNLIKNNYDELKNSPINHHIMRLENIINTNYIINFILLYLCNNKRLAKYYLSINNEDKILAKEKDDPSGINLSFSFLKLLNHFWKGSEDVFKPSEIHQKLKVLMGNNYYSLNPGLIIELILNQLHMELNYKNNKKANPPSWNYEKINALNNFFDYYKTYHSKISEEFYATIRIKKMTSQKKLIYLFESKVVFDLYLNNIENDYITLDNEFKTLFLNMSDINKYCNSNEIFHGKLISSISNILILNIIRNNQKKYLKYNKILNTNNIIDQNVNQNPMQYELYAVIISKNMNNFNIFYAFIQNETDHKWYLYTKDGINQINNENDIYDPENVSLLIYHKKDDFYLN